MPGQTRCRSHEEKTRRSRKVRRSGGRCLRPLGGAGAGQGAYCLPPERRIEKPATGTTHHGFGGPWREDERRTGGASFGGLRTGAEYVRPDLMTRNPANALQLKHTFSRHARPRVQRSVLDPKNPGQGYNSTHLLGGFFDNINHDRKRRLNLLSLSTLFVGEKW